MIKKTTITETKPITRTICKYVCDICGKEQSYPFNKCQICGRDICNSHIGHEECPGDYYEYWCSDCWTYGILYRKQINMLEDDIEALYDKWYEQVKEKVKDETSWKEQAVYLIDTYGKQAINEVEYSMSISLNFVVYSFWNNVMHEVIEILTERGVRWK